VSKKQLYFSGGTMGRGKYTLKNRIRLLRFRNFRRLKRRTGITEITDD